MAKGRRPRHVGIGLVVVLLAAATPVSASHGFTVTSIDGPSVAIDGNAALIGFPSAQGWSGRADVYRLKGGTWVDDGILANPNMPLSAFGHSVAIDDGTIVVGAPTEEEPAGAAHVFVRGQNGWTHEATLTAPADSNAKLFGWSVAVDGDTAIIGARNTGSWEQGAAFVYIRDDHDWQLQASFHAETASEADFGWTVVLDSDTAAVGAPGNGQENNGYVSIFRRTDAVWTKEATLTPPDPAEDFGSAVELDAATILIGSNRDPGQGSADIFRRVNGVWEHDAALTVGWSEGFGFSVALEDDIALVGAPGDFDRGPNAGAIHVFRHGKEGWTNHRKLSHPLGKDHPWFGYAVAIDRGIGIVGSEASAHFLDRDILNDDPPQARHDFFTTLEDRTLSVPALGVLENDVDPDDDTMAAEAWYPAPAHGEVNLGSDGSFTYTPQADFSGWDSFAYRVCAGWGCSEPAQAWIEVVPLNDPPIAEGFIVETGEDTPILVRLRATDIDSSQLIYEVRSGPSHGVLSGEGPDLTYASAQDFNGTDSFTFRASDGEHWSNTATVTITIHPTNDTPAAADDSATTLFYRSITIDVLANDSDVDGDELDVIAVSQATHGTVRINADNTITFTPHETFADSDTFTYTIADPAGATASATVLVIEDTCGGDGLQAFEGTPAEGTASGTVHRVAEPSADRLDHATADMIHYANCTYVVAIENQLDGL